GAALRGFSWTVIAARVLAGNLELSTKIAEHRGSSGALSFWLSAFADGGAEWEDKSVGLEWLADAGLGMSARGRLYDWPLTVRFDVPVFVNQPALAIDAALQNRHQFALRWTITFNDIW